jgi:hypothetical protein
MDNMHQIILLKLLNVNIKLNIDIFKYNYFTQFFF